MPRRTSPRAPLDPVRRALAERYVPLAISEARRRARLVGLGPEAADECQSRAYLLLVEAAARFDPARGIAFGHYAKRCVRLGLRARPQKPEAEFAGLPDDLIDPAAADPAARAELSEAAQLWWSRLTPLQRDLVRITRMEGRTSSEAAHAMGCTRGTVKTYCSDARRRLAAVG